MSAFAIVILSVIGALFKSGHHSMMGSTEDPKDGAAVAASVFGAVIVYAVCILCSHVLYWVYADPNTGFPSWLWLPGLLAHPR